MRWRFQKWSQRHVHLGRNAYVERVIGSLRRECLDYIVIFNERHLRRVLSRYIDYYHQRAPISHSTRIARTRAPHCRPGSAKSLPSRKSMACITATNVSPPDSSRLCPLIVGQLPLPSCEDRAIRAWSISLIASAICTV